MWQYYAEAAADTGHRGQSWIGHLARAERLVTEGTRRAIDAGALYAEGLAQGTRLRLN